jgi:hypothetical protein
MIPRHAKLVVPDHVLFRQLDEESVLLNLHTEQYLGLDEVGTRMWLALKEEQSFAAACQRLLSEYDVEADTVERDLDRLLKQMQDEGLIEIRDA